MLRHIAMFRFTPDSTDEQRRAVVGALRALPGQVATIRGYEVSFSLGLVDGAGDMVIVALFDDEAGWKAYIDHPAHRHVADDLLAPIRIERMTIQHTYPVDQ